MVKRWYMTGEITVRTDAAPCLGGAGRLYLNAGMTSLEKRTRASRSNGES
jgi:hypothetical protein